VLKKLKRLVAANRIVTSVSRKVLPPALKGMVSSAVYEATVDGFRMLLSETKGCGVTSGRVVMVCGSLQPGGAERQVVNTLMGLRGAPLESITLLCDDLQSGTKEKYDFYLPLIQSSGATVRTIKKSWDNIDRATLPSGLREVEGHLRPNLLADIANLYLEFCDLRPEVVHAWLDWSNVRAGLAAVLAGVPRVLMSGRNLNPSHFALNDDYYHPAYSALSERNADQVVFLNNSQAGANDYAAWLSMPAARINVVRNGVLFDESLRPSPDYCSAFRGKLGIPTNAPLIGGMFRFNEEKRPLLWLRAAARVAEALPNAHFILFGQGDMRTQMETLIRQLGIEVRTHLYGTITPSFGGLAPCDVVVLTSRAEGTPNVLLEAQWLGVPVVSTDAGGAAEAVDDGATGFVVPSGDEAAIADAVLRILSSEIFGAHMRTQVPAFISATYGMNRMIKETLALYRLGAEPSVSRPQQASHG
jgi:glycosyltransferase involved in cell wall biosynthesis